MGSGNGFWDRLRTSLEVPELRGLDLDSPQTTELRRELVRKDPAKRFAFEIWYRALAEAVADVPPGKKIELGSGGGFLDEYIDGLIRTEVVDFPFVDMICRAEEMPFADEELSAILLVNVLHHIPDPRSFFRESRRCLTKGGRIAMIEPTVTPLSRFVYKYLHHEPFEPDAREWELPPAGRLSGGNDALPWIIHFRDAEIFHHEFPEFSFVEKRRLDCSVHILSGGVTTRSLVPLPCLKLLHAMESVCPLAMTMMGLFQLVVLKKR